MFAFTIFHDLSHMSHPFLCIFGIFYYNTNGNMLLFRIHHVMNQIHTSKILYATILDIVIHDPHNCCSWWCLLLEQGIQKSTAMRESKSMSISGGRFLLFLFEVVSQIGLYPFCKLFIFKVSTIIDICFCHIKHHFLFLRTIVNCVIIRRLFLI